MARQSDLHFSFVPADCDTPFEVIEFHLHEALSEPFLLEVELASANPSVDFASVLDKPALFSLKQNGQVVRHVHGLVSSFEQLDTGFRRTRYRAVVEPTLARLQLSSDWRIFQQQSVPQIMEQVLKQHHIDDCQQIITADHLPREYCVQAGETHIDFLARLAAEEGFVYRFDFSEKGHQLIHSDQTQVFGMLEGAAVQYNPNAGGDAPKPALRRFSYREQVRTAQQTQRDYTFKHPRYNQQHQVDGRDLEHQQSDYECYDYPGRYKQDGAGRPFTQTRLLSLRNDARMALVEGDDARLLPGMAFNLEGHPRDDLNRAWRPVRITHHGVQHTSQQEEAADAEQGTYYSYNAELIPDDQDWKAPLPAKPGIDGPMMAAVVGPKDEEIYCDEHGRVKVQFPWDRLGEEDEHSTCWIRVSQNWAGASWGHMAIPRIGQEVIVSFLDGDPDQPIITGRTYHAVNKTPYSLPDFKTLSTIKSKEHKGGRANELRIDDTSGEISVALMSDHGASALNLGYLTHPRPSSGEPRGEGFELRTDAHGVLRAGSGMLLTTELRAHASKHHKDMPEAIERLRVAQEQQDSLAGIARDLQAQESGDQDKVAEALLGQNEEIKGAGGIDAKANAFPELSTPHLVLSSPMGIISSSKDSTHIAAGEHIGISSGEHTSLSVGKKLLVGVNQGIRILIQKLGWRLVAASGDIDVRALKDSINLLAKLNISATAERITLSATEEIVINGGGSTTTYSAGGITHKTSGGYTAHAASFTYTGAQSQAVPFPDLPKTGPGNLELFNNYANRMGVKGGSFEVEDALGRIATGVLDAQGFASVPGIAPGPAKVKFGMDPADTWSDSSYVGTDTWGEKAAALTGAVMPADPAKVAAGKTLAQKVIDAADTAYKLYKQGDKMWKSVEGKSFNSFDFGGYVDLTASVIGAEKMGDGVIKQLDKDFNVKLKKKGKDDASSGPSGSTPGFV